jgi:hypothetical protein
MKQKNKLHGVTSFLAICASVVSACICVLLLSGDYHMAQFKMNTYNRELEGWEACRRTNLEYYKANEKAVNSCLISVEEARDNFWVGLSKAKLAGIFVLAALLSASAGYLATWIVLWFIGLGMYKFIRFFAFYRKFCTNKESQNRYNMHSFATKP